MYNRSLPVSRALVTMAIATFVGAVGCSSRNSQVTSETVNPQALQRLKTFSVSAPPPSVERVEAIATNAVDRADGAVMDMDPMLATSVVGRAIRQDLVSAFKHRGYRSVESAPDFDVYYYARMGQVVDTRSSESRYHVDGAKITTRTHEYPAGTIVVDVVDARSDSLLWRGTGVAEGSWRRTAGVSGSRARWGWGARSHSPFPPAR